MIYFMHSAIGSRASTHTCTAANTHASECLVARGKLITANQIKQRHQITLSICVCRGSPNKKFIKTKQENDGENEAWMVGWEGDSIRELMHRVWSMEVRIWPTVVGVWELVFFLFFWRLGSDSEVKNLSRHVACLELSNRVLLDQCVPLNHFYFSNNAPLFSFKCTFWLSKVALTQLIRRPYEM